MKILGRLKIRARLLLGLGFLLILLVATGLMWSQVVHKIIDGIELISKYQYPVAEASKRMEMAVVQVHRVFLETALTRKQADMEEAQKWRDNFEIHSNLALSLARDDETRDEITAIREDFEKYYRVAEVMAKLYIAEGREAGEPLLIDATSFSEALRFRINAVVERNSQAMKSVMEETVIITLDADSASRYASIMLVVVAIIFALFLSNSIISPLRKVSDRLRAFSEDEVADLSRSLEIDTHDEFAELADYFNEFVKKIRIIIVQLAEMAEHLASATTQLSASTEQASAQSKNQLSQVTLVTEGISEVNKAISNIAERTVAVAQASNGTNELAMNGGGVINDSSEAIKTLSAHSAKIGDILLVIEDIAKKTDLLAINAAIEAANAGEQGRGFAVVADEVRKLAERTTRATGEISHMVQDIQKFTGQAVSSMDRSSEAMNNIIIEATRVNEMVDQIAAATEKQSGITSAMLKNVRSVHELSQGFTLQAEQSEKVASEINQETINLQQVADRFKVSTNGVKKETQ